MTRFKGGLVNGVMALSCQWDATSTLGAFARFYRTVAPHS
jgi:hypothetical protein